MSTDAQVPLALESIALSGVSSKAKNYADPDLVINIHAKVGPIVVPLALLVVLTYSPVLFQLGILQDYSCIDGRYSIR